MRWKTLAVACCISISSAAGLCAWGADAPPPTPSDMDKAVQEIKHPVSWFTWGADLRLRDEYIRNSRGLKNDIDDDINMLRLRPRVWADFGPFFSDDSLKLPNGLDFYARMADETRIFTTRPTTGPFATSPSTSNARTFNEIIFDNLYMDWKRIAGLPVSVKVGRQDMVYGRGWLILDGTPLDGSRSIYDDAIKVTGHFDAIKTDLDLFAINNKGYESRLQPIAIEAGQQVFTSEYDADLLGAYLISKYFDPMEINAYYIYKHDVLASRTLFGGKDANGRIVHTVGGLVQGKACTSWDYYLESAFQWGNEGAINGVTTEHPRQGWGVNSDLGYTFKCAATPRIHAGYEYLSGDDASTHRYEAWDPVLSRWPQSSELYVYRFQFEGKPGVGVVGAWTNLQQFTVGASAKPTPKMTTTFDYSYLLANEHSYTTVVPTTVPYGGSDVRGHLFVAKLLYDFNRYMSGHLWAEYFMPGEFYASSRANAVFLRAELMFKF